MILHKVSTSPFADNALQQCLARMAQTDGLLLVQDAVYAVMQQPTQTPFTRLNAVYVLKDDADARGITISDKHIQPITYAGFVELSIQYNNVMSW